MRKKVSQALSHSHEHITGVKPPAGFLRALAILPAVLIGGTLFYSHFEKWSYLDSLYFSVITLATVGYGDLHPITDAAKIFTMFYVFFGVGLVSYVVYTFSKSMTEGRDREIERLEDLIEMMDERDRERRR